MFNAFIEKGNNGILVKEILKRRWWWHITDQPAKANMIWTHWPKIDLLADLPDETPQSSSFSIS